MSKDNGEERIKACLRACEGVSTEFLTQSHAEANERLKGLREASKDVLLAQALQALSDLDDCSWLDDDPCSNDDLADAKINARKTLADLRSF